MLALHGANGFSSLLCLCNSLLEDNSERLVIDDIPFPHVGPAVFFLHCKVRDPDNNANYMQCY